MEPILNFFKERPAIAAIIALVVGLLLGLTGPGVSSR